MEECKSTTPMNQKEKFFREDGAEKVDEGLYRSLIGCLMYLTTTRPNILYTVSLLLRYMPCASEIYFQAAKPVIRYVKAEVEYIAAASVVNQSPWIRKLLTDLCMEQKKSIEIIVDNQAAISMVNDIFQLLPTQVQNRVYSVIMQPEALDITYKFMNTL
ncbi:uncharacterized protein LOC125869718 [Solanum stenotomum]|uniref:uncharacterized protein LOC125869718 n=1 Tax=Solanum stenotomum TaxID=172797 RepID=UPI0020D1AF74|nr:uncharacterized protein LOC125869718 [Solanum stenotomum]